MFLVDLRNTAVKNYTFSVVGNKNVDTVYIYSRFTQYADKHVYVKVLSEDYADKILIDSNDITVKDGCLVVKWTMGAVATACKKVQVQLSFEDNINEQIAQSAIVTITLADTLDIDSSVVPTPSVVAQLQRQIDVLHIESVASADASYADDTLTINLKNADNEVIQTIEVEIENGNDEAYVDAEWDSQNQKIILTKDNTQTTELDLSGAFDAKVDKVEGKGLSTNDFTDGLKTKLDNIETGAEVNAIESISVDSTPVTPDVNKNVNIDLSGKVDKVQGKGLSTNDFTNELKQDVESNTSARHTHSNKSLLDTYTQTEADLASAVEQKHSHSNKAVLDATTASFTDGNYVHTDNNYTDAEKSKLGNIEAGAQVNVLEGVQVDGTDLEISSKKVNIDLTGKVDKVSGLNKVYATDGSGSQTSLSVDSGTGYSGNVARRDDNGQLHVPLAPTANDHAVSKKYLDDKIADISRDSYRVVDTTTYPTLSDFLASTGEEGYLYLYPINTSDLTQGYYRYIWENNAWLDLGTTQIDLSNYYNKTETDTLLGGKQNTIDSNHKIGSDLVDDSNQTNKFVTAQEKSDISSNTSARHTHSNKALLDTYTQTEANLADAVSLKHSHANKALLDTYTQTEANLADAVSKKHEHSNKAVLDAITSAFTTEQATKLGGIETGADKNLVEITWQDLKTLRDNSGLKKGQQYRITDYVTKTAQARTQSANHAFDIIVTADDVNQLNETARAIQHSGDTYFANSKLASWEIKYCLDNNTSRFAWADTTNGKGVIYYMKDEFDNVCHYDFKNIQFARYKVTACANCTSLVGMYVGTINFGGTTILSSRMTIDTSDVRYYYTFDCCGTDYSMNAIGTTITRPDSSTFELTQIQCMDCHIDDCTGDTSLRELNNVVMMLESSRDCFFKLGSDSHDTTLLGGATDFEILAINNSLIGATGVSYIDGYTGQFTRIRYVSDSLICCDGTVQECFLDCDIGSIRNSLITGGSGVVISYSTVEYLGDSVLKASTAVVYISKIGSINNCNISADYIFYYSSVLNIYGCSGTATQIYINYCEIAYMNNVSMYIENNTNPDYFMSYCKINLMHTVTAKKLSRVNANWIYNCNLRYLYACNFNQANSITCAQDLSCCDFGTRAEYLTISSSNTSQVISNTNFHNIYGDGNNTKTLVIPEDYSTEHTVDIYSAGRHVLEL